MTATTMAAAVAATSSIDRARRKAYKWKASDVESQEERSAVDVLHDDGDDGAAAKDESARKLVPVPTATATAVARIKGGDDDEDDSSPSLLPLPSRAAVIAHSTSFFLCMVVHELALEAVSTTYSHLDSLTSAVTLFQFGCCFALPVCVSGLTETMETFPRTSAEFGPYITLSIVVFGATALATESLRYVSYPTKVVFKSAKLIPTMMVSVVVNPPPTSSSSSRRPGSTTPSIFGWMDYASAALLCAGAAGYSYGSSSGRDGGGRDSSTWMGIALLTASVVCDALVPNLQQRLMSSSSSSSSSAAAAATTTTIGRRRSDNGGEGKDEGKGKGGSRSKGARKGGGGLTAAALMTNVNAVGFAALLLYMLASGSLASSVRIALADPALLLYLALVGLGLSGAVLAYTRLIREAGSVVAVVVATLRKVATVILSYVVFPGKPLLPMHVWSGALVLAGVVLNVYHTRRR